MGLQSRSIQKLLREDFLAKSPLVVDPSQRDELAKQIKAKLKRFDRVEMKTQGHYREEDKARLVCTFSIRDKSSRAYFSSDIFQVKLDADNHLTIQNGWRGKEDAATVGDVEEIVRFVQHCIERIQRQEALQAKRDKVRNLLSQAILAQVRDLAKEEKFDFMTEVDPHKFNLFVKLSEDHFIEIHIPFNKFKEILPHLRAMIAELRQLCLRGITFRIGRSERRLPRRSPGWTTHQSL